MFPAMFALALAGGLPAGPLDGAPGAALTRVANGMASGAYACRHVDRPRMALNVNMTGPASCQAPGGSQTGRYALGTDDTVTLQGGPRDGAMPDAFTARDDMRGRFPTLSFIGRSGAEASFREMS